MAALTLTKGLCLGAYLSRGPGTCSYDTRRNIKLGVGNIDNMISQPGGGGGGLSGWEEVEEEGQQEAIASCGKEGEESKNSRQAGSQDGGAYAID